MNTSNRLGLTETNHPVNPGHPPGSPTRQLRIGKPCPKAGTGVHPWIFYAACSCAEAGVSYDDASDFIEENITRAPSPANEIEAALDKAYRVPETAPRIDSPQAGNQYRLARPTAHVWPKRNEKLIAEIGRTGRGLLALWGESPLPIVASESQTERFVDLLFPGNPLLCAGSSQYSFCTHPREDWKELSFRSLIVASPMAAKTGKRKSDGGESFHTLDNTGPRRFLPIEFDTGPLDLHAALLDHLAQQAPLAMCVFSGSKSMHGWFFCEGQDEQDLYRFMRYAVSLGADPATWTRSQFVRMPDGTRNTGKCNPDALPPEFPNREPGRQSVICFNPEVIR